MVVSVCHFTNQVEIAGGGHAPILSGARGPAPPPSAGPRAPDPKTIPIPSLASDSCISIRIGGNDVPFLFHPAPSLTASNASTTLDVLNRSNCWHRGGEFFAETHVSTESAPSPQDPWVSRAHED